MLAFFPAVLASESSAVTFDGMLSSLLAAGNAQDTSKTAQHNIARCIASLTAPTSQQQVNAVVKGLLTQLQVCCSQSASYMSKSWYSEVDSSQPSCCLPCRCDVFTDSSLTSCHSHADWQWRLGSTGRDQGAQARCQPGGTSLEPATPAFALAGCLAL